MAVWSESTLIDASLSRRIDAEFFRPAYLHAERQTRKCNADDLGGLGRFIPGPFGSAFHVKNYDFQSPYRYLRGRDIKPFYILDDDNRCIPEVDFNRLKDYAVQSNDLMISVVGTLGNVAVCTHNETPAIFSCKSTLFRSFGADPYYLLAYLNCYQGQLCLLRRQRGAVQTGLNIEDLKNIPIPRFGNEVESEIASKVQLALKSLHNSKEYYTQAQNLFESEIELDKLSFQKPVGYTARFSELEQSHRSDAQHYQPRFAQLLSHLSTFSPKRIRDICTFNRRGLQPIYVENGPFDVVNSQHLGPQHTDYDGLQKTSGKAFAASTEGHIQNNDLLIYTTGAYIGRTNVYLRNTPALASNHVNILRLNSGIDAAYMALVFQSVVGQFQTQKHARGSA